MVEYVNKSPGDIPATVGAQKKGILYSVTRLLRRLSSETPTVEILGEPRGLAE
jgi:hypothetical protein